MDTDTSASAPAPERSSRPPLDAGSISFRLYPHDLAPQQVVQELAAQAALAERVGFDGVMTSEHHGGFPNYLPNPLLAATWALGATQRIWAAPSPMLLPLRATSQVIEDLAWTAQRFPGRVAAGFAAGAIERDFDMAGVPFDERGARFRAALVDVAAALSGMATGAVADDPAVVALGESPIPVVAAAAGPVAARRTADLGIGLLFDSIVSLSRAAEVAAAHAEAGGTRRVLIRRVWVGDVPQDEVRAQMDRYRAAAPEAARAHWAEDGGLVSGEDPVEVAERLHAQVAEAGCDALNLRVFHAGLTPEQCRAQIERVGAEVLPVVRGLGGWTAAPDGSPLENRVP